MSAPAFDPADMQIMTALASLLSTISQKNGYYNNVAGTGIEPLAFDDGDNYPQIVVQEETSDIAETNAKMYRDELALAVRGFMPFAGNTIVASGLRLRDDITKRLQTVKSSDLIGADGKQLVNSIAIAGAREIKNPDEHADFVEVIVRVQVSHRVFYPST